MCLGIRAEASVPVYRPLRQGRKRKQSVKRRSIQATVLTSLSRSAWMNCRREYDGFQREARPVGSQFRANMRLGNSQSTRVSMKNEGDPASTLRGPNGVDPREHRLELAQLHKKMMWKMLGVTFALSRGQEPFRASRPGSVCGRNRLIFLLAPIQFSRLNVPIEFRLL
jgi:hypothetical protein